MIRVIKEEKDNNQEENITTNQDAIAFTEKQKRILMYALERIDPDLNGTGKRPRVPDVTYGDIKEVYNKLK